MSNQNRTIPCYRKKERRKRFIRLFQIALLKVFNDDSVMTYLSTTIYNDYCKNCEQRKVIVQRIERISNENRNKFVQCNLHNI